MKQAVTITVQSGSPPEVSAQVDGTITSVSIAPTATVDSHTELFAINSHPIFALTEKTPLYRDLKLGDSGPDVLSLARFLVAVGVLPISGADSHFGPQVQSAVMKFQLQAGYSKDGIFQRSYVVYVPPTFGAVSVVSAKTGQEVSGTWTVMAGTAATNNVEVLSASGTQLRDFDGGSVTASIGSEHVDLDSVTPSPNQAQSLVAALKSGVARGDIKVTESVSDGVKTQQFSGASFATKGSAVMGSVPATTIFTNVKGVSCVFESGSSTAWQSAGMKVRTLPTVQVDSGELGQSLIDARFIGRSLARDPSTLPPTVLAQCKS